MTSIKILGIGRGKFVPSTRFRLIEVLTDLHKNNIDIELFIPTISSYPPENTIERVWWGIKVLLSRLPIILKQKKYDIIILQREMVSTLFTLERFIYKPFIFDVDDAIHLNQRFNSIDKIAHKATAIVVCNTYLAEYYRQYNDNVYIVPTPVNTTKYAPIQSFISNNSIVIGWIGTSSNFTSLYMIDQALKKVLSQNLNVKLKIISDKKPRFIHIKEIDYEYKVWSEKDDVIDINSFDIGIMPLVNDEHSQGKCAFKMLQYMSCSLPVVSSALPLNKFVLSQGDAGYSVEGYSEQWIEALESLINNPELRQQMGKNGRLIVVKLYSTEAYAIAYKDILQNIYKKII